MVRSSARPGLTGVVERLRIAVFQTSLLLLLPVLSGCASSPSTAPMAALSGAQTTGPAAQASRAALTFPVDGLKFERDFSGARLSSVSRLGRDHYRLLILPETQPVNPSPWYAFGIVSRERRLLHIEFDYQGYAHRYWPKLSTDGMSWREAGQGEFELDAAGVAHLRLQLEPGSLRVSAQQPFGPDDFGRWIDALNEKHDIHRGSIGSSVNGHELPMFVFGGTPESPLVVVLGRQHPPENTGSRALIGFVETLLGQSELAQAYRGKFRTLVVPLLNPDGVIAGNWRGNSHGIDLNRDWGPFAEPETRAMRDALIARTALNGGRVAFAIDFHSTYQDVLYTVLDDPSRAPGGALRRWIEAMQARFPGRIEEQAYAAATTVFKNWAYCRFGAPALTYEVGDQTDQRTMDTLAAYAAETLMTVLDPAVAKHDPVCMGETAKH